MEWLPCKFTANLLENIAGKPRYMIQDTLCKDVPYFSQGYIPPSFHRHHETLLRKRAEYHSFSAEYFQSNMVMSSDELDILDQIKIDIPRTASLGNLLHDEMIIT